MIWLIKILGGNINECSSCRASDYRILDNSGNITV